MQTKRFFVVVGLALAAACVLQGCSESTARRTSKKLNEATQTSARLSERALALRANPKFTLASKQFSPLETSLVPLVEIEKLRRLQKEKSNDVEAQQANIMKLVKEKIVPVSNEEVHPEIQKTLVEARDTLLTAYDQAGETPGTEGARAAALAQVATVQNVLGQMYWQQFDNGRSSVMLQAAIVEFNAMGEQREAALVAAMDTLLKPVYDKGVISYEESAKQAKAQQATVQAEVDKLAAEVKKLEDARAAIQGEINTLQREASDLQLAAKAQTQDINKALALFEQGNAKEDQALAKTKAMQETEASLDAVQVQLSLAQTKLDVLTTGIQADSAPASGPAGGRVQQADQIVKQYQAMLASAEKFKQEAQKRQADYQKHKAEGLSKMGQAYKEAMDLAERDALKQFEGAMQRARTSATLQADPMTKALEGEAARQYANIRQQQRDMLTVVLAVVAKANGNVKDVTGGTGGDQLVKDLTTSAVDKLGESAKAFESAVAALRTKGRMQHNWAYQANAALSHMQQAMLTADAGQRKTAYDEATRLLTEAVSNKENSPYLQYVRQVRAQLATQMAKQ